MLTFVPHAAGAGKVKFKSEMMNVWVKEGCCRMFGSG